MALALTTAPRVSRAGPAGKRAAYPTKGEPVSKLLVLVLAAAAAAYFARSKRSGSDRLRSRAKDAASTAGDKLSDAQKRVEEAVRS